MYFLIMFSAFALAGLFPVLWAVLERRGQGAENPENRPMGASGPLKYPVHFFVGYFCLLGVLLFVLSWAGEKSARWEYHGQIKTQVRACERAGHRATCADLARKYRYGVSGSCSRSHRTVPGNAFSTEQYTTQCIYRDPDPERANFYAEWACRLGDIEGCFYAYEFKRGLRRDRFTDEQRQETLAFCQNGSFAACRFANQLMVGPANTGTVHPPIHFVDQACDDGNLRACIHAVRHRLLIFYEDSSSLALPDDEHDEMIRIFETQALTRADHAALNGMQNVLFEYVFGGEHRSKLRDPQRRPALYEHIVRSLKAVPISPIFEGEKDPIFGFH